MATLPSIALVGGLQTPHGAWGGVKGVRGKRMEKVGRGKCDGLEKQIRRRSGGDSERGWR